MDNSGYNGYDGFNGDRPRPKSGFDPYYSDKIPKSDFKVSINDSEGGMRSQSVGSNAPVSHTEPASRMNESDEKFKVSIPEQRKRPNPAARPASGSAGRTASGKSAGKQNLRKKAPAAKGGSSKGKKMMTAQQAAKARERRKQRIMKNSLGLCVCLICIAIITTIASTIALSTLNDILAINKESGTTVSIVVNEGDKFNEVIDTLADNDLISQKLLVKLFCKFRHYDGYFSKKQNKYIEIEYQPGVYYLDTSSGVEAMLETLMASNANSKETARLTFPEGSSIAQIFQKIEKQGICKAEQLYANLDIVGKQFGFYEKITSNSGRYLKAEGYLFPDTYDFYIGENASSVLKKLFSNFQKKWTSEYNDAAKKLGYSVDEIITIASIIQREAKDKSQMANISSVLYNRLADPSVYPNLQMNSTKDYINSMKDFKVFTDYYYSVYLDSYNTYNIEGLPPGAICNPGIDAIEAALHPAQTDYHFFCHDKKGNIYLAVTAAEHKQNEEKVFYED